MKRTSLIALAIGLVASALSAQTATHARKVHRMDWAKLKAQGAIRKYATLPKASRITRDASGRVTKVLEPDTHGYPTLETDITYDTNGRVIKIVQHGAPGDALRVRSFTYDAHSRVLSATSPEAGTVTYTYDANGNVATRTDARNLTIAYTWDTKHRLLTKTYSDDAPAAHLLYDDTFHTVTTYLGAKDKPLDKRIYQYDSKGLLHSLTIGSGSKAYTVTLQYDSTGHLTSITYPDGYVVTQTLDAKGRLDSVSSATTSFLSSPTYSTTNTLTGFTLGNAISVQRTFDTSNRLAELSAHSRGQLILDKTYDYDPSGDITRFIDKLDKESSYRYIYDELNRVALSEQTDGNRKESFAYDAFGNRAASDQAAEKPHFTDQNQFTPATGLKYDDAGDMTFDGTHTYTYNADGYIASVDKGAVTYTYDAEGNRIARRVKTAKGEAVTEFIWLEGKLLAQHLPDGRWIDSIYFKGQRIASVATHLDPSTGNSVADATTYFLADTVGLTRVAFAADGTVLVQGDFAPFGEEIRDRTAHTTPGIASAASISFSDEVHDDETGLDTYKFRSYNPHLGRWMTPDPSSLHYSNLAVPQGFNLYAYVTNDPLKYIDRLGLEECDCADDDGWYEEEGLSGGGGGGGGGGDDGGYSTTPPVVTPPPDDPNTSTTVTPDPDPDPCPVDTCVTVTADPDPPLDPTPGGPSDGTIPDDPDSPDPGEPAPTVQPCVTGNCNFSIYYGSSPIFGNACSSNHKIDGSPAGLYSLWSCAGDVSSCASNALSFQNDCRQQGQTPIDCSRGLTVQYGQFFVCPCCSF